MINRKRVYIILVGLLMAYGLIGYRLGILQMGTYSDASAAVLAQNSVEVSLEEYPRGQILDRNGVSLTSSGQANRVVIIPHYIEEKWRVAADLAGILQVDQDVILAGMNEPGVLPYPVTSGDIREIRTLSSQGVIVLPVQLRYGDQALAPHVTGHLGKIASVSELERITAETGRDYLLSDWVGKSGIEAQYEGLLRGERPTSLIRSYRDARLKPIPGLDLMVEQDDLERGDVILTLDARIQRIAENVLVQADRGALVVSDIHTGDILAMASSPQFSARDPFVHADEALGDVFFNRTTALYQPGSVFKTVVAAAALESGGLGEGAVYNCEGGNDKLITCWHEGGHGAIDLAEAFAQSCNPYFAQLAMAVGAERLAEYAAAFGLSDQTIRGYPFEPDTRQNLDLIKEPFSLVNSGVGQGPVLVSPVQVNSLMCVIANGGIYRQPRLVDRVEGGNGLDVMISVPESEPTRVMTRETAAEMRELLLLATTEGQGKLAYLENGGSAGKTGSAQVGDTGKVNAWFTGYFPTDSPRYAITVLVEDGISGGESAAPLFREAAAGILAACPE